MLSRLNAAIRAVCPLDGSAFLNGVDQAGGVRLDYGPGATAQQQTNAQAVLAGFDWSQAAQDAWDAEQTAKVVGLQTITRVIADRSFDTNQFADVQFRASEFGLLLAPNTHYRFRISGAYTSVGATTGAQFSVSGPASPDFLGFSGQLHETATSVRAVVGGAYDVALAGTASAGATPMGFWLEGTITTGAQGGQLKLRARSETNGNAIVVKRGTFMDVSAVL